MLVSVFLAVIQEFPYYAAEYPQLDELLDPGDVHLLHFISQVSLCSFSSPSLLFAVRSLCAIDWISKLDVKGKHE